MVFKPISHLARRSTKAFTHGYAQSLAAASQSSYASTNTNLGPFNNHRLTNRGSTTRRDAFYSSASAGSASIKDFSPFSTYALHSDAASEALLGAWPKYQHDEEWQPGSLREAGRRNVSSSRARELSKLLSVSPQAGGQQLAPSHGRSETRLSRDGANLRIEPPDPAANTSNDRDAWNTSQPHKFEIETQGDSLRPARDSSHPPRDGRTEGEAQDKNAYPLLSPTVATSQNTGAAQLSGSNTEKKHPHVQQILALEDSGQYAGIPPLFESLLCSGVVPPVKAYNALVASATKLAPSRSESIAKVLEVYTDMLRHQLQPDSRTYTLLLELLASRAIEIAQMRALLRQESVRFNDFGRTSRLPSRSLELKHSTIAEDDSLQTAIRLFKLATASSQSDHLSSETYAMLIDACAANEEVDHMIRVYAHMEEKNVSPLAAVYPPMIQAFASRGDLRSSVECYNEYKHLVTKCDSGSLSLTDRLDSHVYAAVVGSYLKCGKAVGAERFYSKITTALAPYPNALQEVRDVITLQAFTMARLGKGQFRDALEFVEQESLSPRTRDTALDMISTAAADRSEPSIACDAHGSISDPALSKSSSLSILAMHLRQGDIEASRKTWTYLCNHIDMDQSFVEPTVMYATALIHSGDPEGGLEQARQAFASIRASNAAQTDDHHTPDMIDESIERLHCVLMEAARPSTATTMALMWTMMDNGGLLLPVAEQLLAYLGPQDISLLEGSDLDLALYIEAGFVRAGKGILDVAHTERLAHLLRTALDNGTPLCGRTIESISSTVPKLEPSYPALTSSWTAAKQQLLPASPVLRGQSSRPPSKLSSAQNVSESFDPYANGLDMRGSSIIVDELEKTGANSANTLNECLVRFKNMRRAGRHPRYIAYAKLIGAAAKEGRSGLISDIYEMAKHDVPLLAQFPAVRHGWTNILDAMVGAYLTIGRRSLASGYHEQLLEIGSAPTANTYGLYITTLKESSKTLDEASEAVKIFRRARSEGVEPTSFLYNALIGKLGKARRIDDCLFYFAEMRTLGIRPTSVTYGTIVNALCRVSDERFAQDLFDEMESMANYKPRPAPYNSMMQFFLTAKRDSSKVLEYYRRMQARAIKPTMHTYKLLIDTYASLEPINLAAAEGILETMRSNGHSPETIHYASLVHAKGCVLQDMDGAQEIFDRALRDPSIKPQASLYQAYFESMVANHRVQDTEPVLKNMIASGVEMTPYIGNTLIHGWTQAQNVDAAKAVYDSIGIAKREPSTYEAMTRGFLAVERRESAAEIVQEMLSRGYPSAVSGKILELLSHRGPNEAVLTPLKSLSRSTLSVVPT